MFCGSEGMRNIFLCTSEEKTHATLTLNTDRIHSDRIYRRHIRLLFMFCCEMLFITIISVRAT